MVAGQTGYRNKCPAGTWSQQSVMLQPRGGIPFLLPVPDYFQGKSQFGTVCLDFYSYGISLTENKGPQVMPPLSDKLVQSCLGLYSYFTVASHLQQLLVIFLF